MQLSILYTSIALLNADFGNVGQYTLLLHGIPTSHACLGNRQFKNLPNSSATEYNPIAKDFLDAGNLDIFCRHSGVRYCIPDLFKNTDVDLSLLTVHAGLLQINILFLIPYTENYMA